MHRDVEQGHELDERRMSGWSGVRKLCPAFGRQVESVGMTAPETRIGTPECACLCHEGNVVVHPVPCCAVCPHCGSRVPSASSDHRCRPFDSHGRSALPWRGLQAKFYRVAPLLIALIVMALAVWSVPYPACLLFAAVGLIGGLIAMRRIQHPPPSAPHVAGPSVDEEKE
jgi:hypothetical protein